MQYFGHVLKNQGTLVFKKKKIPELGNSLSQSMSLQRVGHIVHVGTC